MRSSIFYKGRVKLVVISDQGKEAGVGILEAGQFFGEGCLNGHCLRVATTIAMEECLIQREAGPFRSLSFATVRMAGRSRTSVARRGARHYLLAASVNGPRPPS
jgi:CRP-like cAMP-binding protein